MTITVRNVTKRFGGDPVLRDVDLDVAGGELVALLGPSGSGKTTLLRVIAGLETADTGSVTFRETARAGGRRVGFVFQHYALFRHMTVFENVAFGLRVRPRRERPAEAEIRRRVHELLALVQLQELEARRPSELSGGQRQRVALARALAIEPEVLLLDEPFGALDATVRRELRRWLRRLHETLHVTTLFVTHDQEEALEVADRLVVMRDGRIEQVGTPEEVYEKPASDFVYRFLGDVTLFHGRTMRPHEIRLLAEAPSADAVPATVRRVRPLGAVVRVALEAASAGVSFEVDVARERFQGLGIARGDRVFAEPLTPEPALDNVSAIDGSW